jgi:predicted ribonuclease YlaK
MADQSSLLVFPDTNVLIQGRALKEQAWGELGRDTIDIMLSGPVIRELDRLKNRPGRVGKAARSMSTKVRELMSSTDRAEVLREAAPEVTLRLAPGTPNQAKAREEIDLTHDDQAIINQALASLPPDRR